MCSVVTTEWSRGAVVQPKQSVPVNHGASPLVCTIKELITTKRTRKKLTLERHQLSRMSHVVHLEIQSLPGSANSLAPSPPCWSRNCGGCWHCWSPPVTWRTAGDRWGKWATECCPLPTPSVYSSCCSRRFRGPWRLCGSGQRWWCRCWGPAWSAGTCPASSRAGTGRRCSRRGWAPAWWLASSGPTCRPTGTTLQGHERGPGSPAPKWWNKMGFSGHDFHIKISSIFRGTGPVQTTVSVSAVIAHQPICSATQHQPQKALTLKNANQGRFHHTLGADRLH